MIAALVTGIDPVLQIAIILHIADGTEVTYLASASKMHMFSFGLAKQLGERKLFLIVHVLIGKTQQGVVVDCVPQRCQRVGIHNTTQRHARDARSEIPV